MKNAIYRDKFSTYQDISQQIQNEIQEVLLNTDKQEVEILIKEILAAEKVFIFAVGRVFLALQCFGKRLGHLGIDCQVVGSITEKPISPNDLLLIASGSGESKLPIEISRIAKSKKARLGLITSNRKSTIKSMSDFAVHLPCPTKNDSTFGIISKQPMSTLFDQSLHIFCDIIAVLLQNIKGIHPDDLWQFHANLE